LRLDVPLSGGLLGLALSGHWYQSRVPALESSTLLQLNRQEIWAFDRSASLAWRPRAASLSDVGLVASVVSPLLLLASSRVRNHRSQHLLLWSQTLFMVDGLTNWTKALTLRNRPFNYFYAANFPNNISPDLAENVAENDARFSFFSGHTSYAAAGTFFLAQTFNDYYPDSRLRPWIWASAALLPAAVGFLRVRAGKHYPSDVVVGYLVGAAVGMTIPLLHRRN
ncbi:MAG: phosphatase PAP2 family protein, partial [Bacteroidota bacterium]